MYVESWACTDNIYENFKYSYFNKTETVTAVTKIIIDQLQLSQRCPNCLNCVYQNCWILSWLRGITKIGSKRKHATDLYIYTLKSVIKYYNYFSSPVYILVF